MTRSLNHFAAAALVALAAGPFLSAQAATSDADLAVAVQSALSTSLGSDATKDLTVIVHGSSVILHGWTQGPVEEAKARYIASKVPGVRNAYSTVRTFSTENDE